MKDKKLIQFKLPKKPFSYLHIHGGIPLGTKVKCFFCEVGLKARQITNIVGNKMIIGKVESIRITDTRADFDKACADAYYNAIEVFGITVDGCSNKVDFVRSTDTIHIKFVRYEHVGTMIGHEHLYEFEAWIEREE